MRFSAIFIGSSQLMIDVMKLWMSKNNEIVGVISLDQKIVEFTTKYSIELFDEYENSLKECDYLFSICNFTDIDKEIFKKIHQIAVNCEFNPYPEYSGWNGISWAIINESDEYGCALRIINNDSKHDEVISKSTFKLTDKRNGKLILITCFSESLKLFESLFNDIEEKKVTFHRENNKNIKKYKIYECPNSYGYIDFSKNLNEIKKYNKAMLLGDKICNYFCTQLLLYRNNTFYIGNIRFMESKGLKPGKLIQIQKNGLWISCQDAVVICEEITTISGEDINTTDKFKQYGFEPGVQIETPDDFQIQTLNKIVSKYKPHEPFWFNKFKKTGDMKKLFGVVRKEKMGHLTLKMHILKELDTDLILTLVLATFSRLNNNVQITVSFGCDETIDKRMPGNNIMSGIIPFTIHVDENQSIEQLLNHVKNKRINDMKKYPYLEDIGKRLNITMEVEQSRHYTIIIVSRSSLLKKSIPSGGILTLIFCIDVGLIKVICNDSFIKKGIARSINKCIEIIYKQHKTSPRTKISKMKLINERDEDNKNFEYVNVKESFLYKKTVHELIEEQVIRSPHNIAAISNGISITYEDLNTKANQLACHIRNQFLLHNRLSYKKQLLIGLIFERSLEMIISLLAVQKAGGAYLPIDINIPNSRLNFILEDAKIDLVLTLSKYKNEFNHRYCHVDKINLNKYNSENLRKYSCASDLIYIIYTSGSTGKPKGVKITHRGIVNKIEWIQRKYPIDFNDTVINKTPYTFDVSVREIFWPLCFGAKILCADNTRDNDPFYINKSIQKFEVSVIQFVPSLLNMFLSALEDRNELIPKKLKYMFCAGELLHHDLISRFMSLKKKSGSKCSLINFYGLTESSMYVTYYECREGDSGLMGTPVANTKCYVLDKNKCVLPTGIPGELYVGGLSVGAGYLNRPVLTKRLFIDNPFEESTESKSKLFRTGDIVRELPNNLFEYVGRKDNQVKLNGVRIELGEVESCILDMPEISQAIVVLKEYKDRKPKLQYLVAYYKTHNEVILKELKQGHIKPSRIKEHLELFLPDYMVPYIFVELDIVPLNINGKVNRKKLPTPPYLNKTMSQVQSSCSIEKQLSNICQELLKVKHINFTDNFFTVGCNSIIAIQLMYTINEHFKTNINILDIFQNSTVLALSRVIKESTSKYIYDPFRISDHKSNSNNTEAFPLTFVQQAYIFGRDTSFSLGNISTHSYSEWLFDKIDIEMLEKSFNVLVKRHDALRIVISDNKQKVLDNNRYYHFEFYGSLSKNGLDKVRSRLSHKSHRIDRFPLYEIGVSVYEKKYIVHYSRDLLIVDALSFSHIVNEWSLLYNSRCRYELPKIHVSFRDYVIKYHQIKKSKYWLIAKKYWESQLQDFEKSPKLPLLKPLSKVKSPSFNRITKHIDRNLWIKVKDKANKLRISYTSVILYAYLKILLYWSNADRFTVNLTLFNRLPLHSQINSLVGDFTSLTLFNYVDENNSIKNILTNINTKLFQNIEHASFDGIDCQRAIRAKNVYDFEDIIFPVVLTSILGEKRQSPSFNGFNKILYAISQTPQVCLDNEVYETDTGLVVSWDYVEQVFEKEAVIQMHEKFCTIIKDLSIVDWAEKNIELELPPYDREFINRINNTNETYPSDTLLSLFLKSVHKHPNNTAVIDPYGEYTYENIHGRSKQLAAVLLNDFISNKKLTAIWVEKSVCQVIAALAIFFTGKAYLPIHTEWPLRRIKTILEEGDVENVLISKAVYSTIKDKKLLSTYSFIVIDHIENILTIQNNFVDIYYPKRNDLAYVIFTSGTTGQPKGVSVSHDSVTNTLHALNNKFAIGTRDKILALSDLSFDLSVYDIFGLLAAGGTIVFPKQNRVDDPSHWSSLINHYSISLWNTVPQLMQLLVDQLKLDNISIPSLRLILMSGDWIPLTLPNEIKSISSNPVILSLGGATEASIWSIWFDINKVELNWTSIPYGVPMPNQKILVLNKNHKDCPVGVYGDIYIGGDGVAKGYWKDNEKTQVSFIYHKKWGRIYKTGDLGKWNRCGYVEFIGREDQQIKINGYRVEIPEIERALLNISFIRKAIVLTRKTKIDKKSKNVLIAYYILNKTQINNTHKTTESALSLDISERLLKIIPKYMIPSIYILVDSFPLSQTGKINTEKLLALKIKTRTKDNPKPTSDIEILICKILKELLPLAQIGIHDDFFTLGGDSITSIQLSARLMNRGIEVNIGDIFKHRTIASLTKLIHGKKKHNIVKANPENYRGEFDLLPIQFWFFEREFENEHYFNQSFLLKVPSLDRCILEDAIHSLILRHDSLKLRFSNESGRKSQTYQEVLEKKEIKYLNKQGLSKQKLNTILTDWQSHFNIYNGPLWCVGYIDGYKDGSARLYLAFHHLIMDTVSWRILSQDIKQLYGNESLPSKRSSYKQWVESVHKYRYKYAGELTYWKKQLENTIDYSNVWTIQKEIKTSSFNLNVSDTKILIGKAKEVYHAEVNDLLLTGLLLALKDITKQDIHAVLLEGHGRDAIDPTLNINETVGWFTTIYPVLINVGIGVPASIKLIKEALRTIPNNGMGFGILRYYGNEGHTQKALPSIGFNYLGSLDSSKSNWTIAHDFSGINSDMRNRNDKIVDIDGMVKNGQLHFALSCKLLSKEVNHLSNKFKTYLKKITSHCLSLSQKGKTYFTPSDLSTVTISNVLLDKLQKDRSLVDIFPANSLQVGFIKHSLSSSKDDAYSVQMLLDYNEHINHKHYKSAWQNVIETYPILRTSFNWEESIIQLVYKHVELDWRYVDLSQTVNKDKEVKRIQSLDRKRRFNLKKPHLIRIILIKLNYSQYTVIRSVHHSIMDGWSIPLLFSKAHQYYNSLIKRVTIDVKEDTAYCAAQTYISNNKKEVKSFWLEKIPRFKGRNDLSIIMDKPANLERYNEVKKSASMNLTVDNDIYAKLKQLITNNSLTLSTLLQFAWHKLIQIYTRDQQTIVGTVVSGRALPVRKIEESVGLYINTLPLMIDWDEGKIIINILQEIQNQTSQLEQYSYEHLTLIQKDTGPMFHSIFAFENYPVSERIEEDHLKMKLRDWVEKINYPFGIMCYEKDNSIKISFLYDASLLTTDTMQRILGQYLRLLEQVPNLLDKSHSSLSFIHKAEHELVCYKWNQTDTIYNDNKTASQLFEEQVKKTPYNIAIVYDNKQYTYQDLNGRSNQLARYIREIYLSRNSIKLKSDTIIAVCLERSFDLIVVLLSILKAGGAYLCIDTNYPKERVNYIITDASPALILTNSEHRKKILCDSVLLDQLCLDSYPKCDFKSYSHPDDLIYVMYTSGSTGKPKGVLIENKSVINLVVSMYTRLNLSQTDTILQFSSIGFDASVFEIYTALLNGMKLCISTDKQKHSIDYLADLIMKEHVSLMFLTPSFASCLNIDRFKSIKKIILGGEKADSSTVKKWGSVCQVYNGYGPTEGTVFSFVHDNLNENSATTIGKSLPNIKAYVLDKDKRPVPIGFIGELYIAGACIARGYLNKPMLTKAHFFPNMYMTERDRSMGYTRMYKTGDLVRWHRDGNMEYIGREDFQVKIRGIRIELGEIENCLSKYPGIRESIILSQEKVLRHGLKGHILIAYYSSNFPISDDRLASHLSEYLPEYMLPNLFIHLECFPLTQNGKVDREALTCVDISDNKKQSISPSTKVEHLLAEEWMKLLNISRVGVYDDFFSLGGDSIISIQLSSKLLKKGIKLSVGDIFEHRTIASLSAIINKQKKIEHINKDKVIYSGLFDLVPIQNWFFERKFPNEHYFNQSFLLKVPLLNKIKLEEAIKLLISQHDILRVRFIKRHNSVQQYYSDKDSETKVSYLNRRDLSAQALNEKLTDWGSHFNIEFGPLWKVGYIEGYADGSARIYFAFHHLIMDTVSWRILAHDIKQLYEEKTLSSKGSSYQEWVETIKSYAVQNSPEQSYWKQQTKFIDEHNQRWSPGVDITNNYFELTPTESKLLIGKGKEIYHAEVNDYLLAGFVLALKELTEQNDHTVLLEGHGRESVDSGMEINETVGWFTTIYPILLVASNNIAECIKEIKESLHKVPNKGIGFGALRYYGERIFSDTSLPKITFNYLGSLDNKEKNWCFINENAGKTNDLKNHDDRLIDVNGIFVNGKLHFSLECRLSPKDADKLTEYFKEYLQKIASHCLSKLKTKQSYFTPSDFPTVDISSRLLDKLQINHTIKAIYPANSLQIGFIKHALTFGQDDAYCVQTTIDIFKSIDENIYRLAWQKGIDKYPVLRTCFNWEESIVQIIHKKVEIDWQYFDISKKKDKEKEVEKIKGLDRGRGFKLETPHLIRITLIKQASGHYTVILTVHHSIIDGWSMPLLINQIHDYYDELIKGKNVLVEVENAYCESQIYITKKQKSVRVFWEEKLRGFKERNDLGLMLEKHQHLDNYNIVQNTASENLLLNRNDYKGICQILKDESLTLNTVLQFAWHKLIQIYTSDKQTTVGTIISGRSLPVLKIEQSVGLYINTLPLMINWDKSKSVCMLLKEIQKEISSLEEHSYVHLSSLHKDGVPLFQSLFVFENYPAPKRNSKNGLKIQIRDWVEKVNYPFCLLCYEAKKTVQVSLLYDKNILSKERAKRLLEQYQLLIKQIPNSLSNSHVQLSVLDAKEYNLVINEWNKTDSKYNDKLTVIQLFEEQVKTTPNNIAVCYDGTEYTYEVLNKHSNKLARYIRTFYQKELSESLQPDTIVGVCMERSYDLIVAILAILKAGAAYLPIEHTYPSERINTIVNDSNIPFALTSTVTNCRIQTTTIVIDKIYLDLLDDHDLELYALPNNLMYLMYTSGSTGTPKGVLIELGSVVNLSLSLKESLNLINDYNVIQFSSIAFDASVFEMFATLLNGLSLIVCDDKTKMNPFLLEEFVHKNKINVAFFTPSFSLQLTTACLQAIDILLLGGENEDHMLRKISKNKSFYHVYGITETTVFSTLHLCRKKSRFFEIGKPLHNVKCYVLDENLYPCPVGIRGELYLSGITLSRGYLNQPCLTNQKFIKNPYASQSDIDKGNNRLYKSGDIVAWAKGGSLDYFHRDDQQVQIRGMRVELGEIEHVLEDYPEIKQAVIIPQYSKLDKNTENQILVAYYSSTKPLEPNILELYLKKRLPSHMIPSHFFNKNTLPININGKVDRNKLIRVDISEKLKTFINPVSQNEKLACLIWSKLLKIDKVGIKDDFISLGGNSIIAIPIIQKMNKELNKTFQIVDLYKYRTISDLLSCQDIKSQRTINKVNLIRFLNENNIRNKTIYFIHPSGAGCEVYKNIANKIQNKVNIVGIDNYNLYHKNKIDRLDQLAKIYFDQLLGHVELDNEIHICGWSLGGQIALQIAGLLEEKGFKQIKLSLLDTYLSSKHGQTFSNENVINIQKQYQTFLNGKKLHPKHIAQLLELLPIEYKLSKTKTNTFLQFTNVELIKALKSIPPDRKIYDEIDDGSKTHDNNVQQHVKKKIRIIDCNCHHYNIIDFIENNLSILMCNKSLNQK